MGHINKDLDLLNNLRPEYRSLLCDAVSAFQTAMNDGRPEIIADAQSDLQALRSMVVECGDTTADCWCAYEEAMHVALAAMR